jgi:Flp pilus assembly protein TadD
MARMELVRARPQEALELARIGSGKRGAFETLNVIQAQALSALGKQTNAMELLDQRLQERPDDPDLLAARARLYLLEGLPERAEEFLRRAVDADALHAGSSLALATLFEEQGRAQEATVVLENLLSIDPGNPAALASLGRVRLDDPERARAYLEEAVRLNPSRFEPLVSLGVCYLKLEMPDKAEASLRRALVLQPENVRCRNNLAVALFLQKRLRDAEMELGAIIAQAPDFAEAHNNLALVLHSQGKTTEAERSAREALRLQPELRDAILTLATVLHDQGRFLEEVAILEPLVGRESANPQVSARYGVALEATSRCEEAWVHLEFAMDFLPNQPRLTMSAGRCAEAKGDLARAMQLYERTAQIAPRGELRTQALAAIERLARTPGVETKA